MPASRSLTPRRRSAAKGGLVSHPRTARQREHGPRTAGRASQRSKGKDGSRSLRLMRNEYDRVKADPPTGDAVVTKTPCQTTVRHGKPMQARNKPQTRIKSGTWRIPKPETLQILQFGLRPAFHGGNRRVRIPLGTPTIRRIPIALANYLCAELLLPSSSRLSRASRASPPSP